MKIWVVSATSESGDQDVEVFTHEPDDYDLESVLICLYCGEGCWPDDDGDKPDLDRMILDEYTTVVSMDGVATATVYLFEV